MNQPAPAAADYPERQPSLVPRPLEGVVFDMDGLLLDTEAVQKNAMREAARELGFPLPDAVIRATVGVHRGRNRVTLREALGDGFPLDAFYAEVDRRFDVVIDAGAPLRPGVHELLDLLEAAGVPRAVATSTDAPYAQRRLRSAGILERFAAVVTVGDVARPKPAPDPYLRAAALLGARPGQCLALDDSNNGVRSALAAGLVTIMVPDLVGPEPDIAGRVATLPSLMAVADLLRPELGGR